MNVIMDGQVGTAIHLFVLLCVSMEVVLTRIYVIVNLDGSELDVMKLFVSIAKMVSV